MLANSFMEDETATENDTPVPELI